MFPEFSLYHSQISCSIWELRLRVSPMRPAWDLAAHHTDHHSLVQPLAARLGRHPPSQFRHKMRCVRVARVVWLVRLKGGVGKFRVWIQCKPNPTSCMSC